MTFLDWFLQAGTTGVLLTLAAFLLRSMILTRLKASVEHEFDAKLETIRAELCRNEESFKADLRSKEAQIEILRNGALSALAGRQAILDTRRLEAVEQLWGSIEKLAPLKAASSMMDSFDFTKSLAMAAQEQKVRDFFSTLGKSFGVDSLPTLDAHKARPFVPEIVWALFAAYQAILYHAVVQVQMLKVGTSDPKLLNTDHVPKLVKAALPWSAQYLDTYGPSGFYNMLEPLEAELLKELQRMMRGEEFDKATVVQAATIMKEVAIVNQEISKGSVGNAQSTSA